MTRFNLSPAQSILSTLSKREDIQYIQYPSVPARKKMPKKDAFFPRLFLYFHSPLVCSHHGKKTPRQIMIDPTAAHFWMRQSGRCKCPSYQTTGKERRYRTPYVTCMCPSKLTNKNSVASITPTHECTYVLIHVDV